MSSSDSDDDCYGNVASKLQTLKNTYSKSDDASVTKLAEVVTEDVNSALKSTDDDEGMSLDAIIANHSTKRGRGRKRKCDSTPTVASTRRTRSSRRKPDATEQIEAAVSTSQPSVSTVPISKTSTPSQCRRRGSTPSQCRGRGRDRARGSRTPSSRGREDYLSQMWMNLFSNIPIFSIGNTDEYSDTSDNQQLFAQKKEDIVTIEPDILDENEELSVKVFWQSCDVYKFKIRRFQKITKIFEHFSNAEKVSKDKLLFLYNDNILKEDDTPDSIDYSIAKFIDGGVVSQNVTDLVRSSNKKKVKDGITVKFQCQNVKKPYEVVIQREDNLAMAMMQCAEHIEVPLNRLKFYFDGDLITGKSTVQELELEGGECIDVNLTS